ncbi:MAG: cation-transporting P-type ATPase [Bacteriovoracaceae bacterium]|nr:cation-transporting P-type ATPase [Bacteriovoracaceae bacterium]
MNQSSGLLESEISSLREKFGFNEWESPLTLRESTWFSFVHALFDPMVIMLIVLAVIYFFLGQISDGQILLISTIPMIAVDVVLNFRSQNALKSLKKKLKSEVRVLRDGKWQSVSEVELLPGDILSLDEGQILVADGEILESHQLSINESSLTGESLPVEKIEKNKFFAGTAIIQGRGMGIVESIGNETKWGKLAHLLQKSPQTKGPLEIQMNKFVTWVIWIALILCAILFFINWIQGKEFFASLIAALTFAMAVIPEEFPLVFTIYLAMGAWRLSRVGVLVKSLPSVEALGSVDVLATDKTGTLTEGIFKLTQLQPMSTKLENDSEINIVSEKKLWQIALMACEVVVVDAMEKSIYQEATAYIPKLKGWFLKHDYLFETKGKHMSHVWEEKGSGKQMIAMKGSVEGVLEHCEVPSVKRKYILEQVEIYASQGKRLLGLAFKEGSFSGLREQDETSLTFAALLHFHDPVRKEVKAVIDEFQTAGIEIKMITGDHPLTAHAVAEELNITHQDEFIFTGPQLETFSEAQRQAAYLDGAIFCRVLPLQKYEMVKVLQAKGKIIAMTGDGVNDAAALKLANIGISMGHGASDVARQSAKMILLKNDFRGMLNAFYEGRKIFSGLRRSFSFLISFHTPVILLSMIPPLIKMPSLFLPIHVVLLELIVHPISAFCFENLPLASFKEKNKNFFKTNTMVFDIAIGLFVSTLSLGLYFYLLKIGKSIEEARSAALLSLLISNMGFVTWNSYPYLGRKLLYGLLGLLFIIAGCLFSPSIQKIFYLTPMSLPELMVTGILTVSIWILLIIYRAMKK